MFLTAFSGSYHVQFPNNQPLITSEGSLLAIPAGQPFDITFDGPGELTALGAMFRGPGGLDWMQWLRVPVASQFAGLIELLQALTTLGTEPSGDLGIAFERQSLAASWLSECVARYSGEALEGDLFAIQRILPAFTLIDREPAAANRETMANACHLSIEHFHELFRAATGLPPHRYLLQQRIDQAARELVQTDATMEVIADQLGFHDAFHLSKQFKRHRGMSPKAFRQAAREAMRQIRGGGPDVRAGEPEV